MANLLNDIDMAGLKVTAISVAALIEAYRVDLTLHWKSTILERQSGEFPVSNNSATNPIFYQRVLSAAALAGIFMAGLGLLGKINQRLFYDDPNELRHASPRAKQIMSFVWGGGFSFIAATILSDLVGVSLGLTWPYLLGAAVVSSAFQTYRFSQLSEVPALNKEDFYPIINNTLKIAIYSFFLYMTNEITRGWHGAYQADTETSPNRFIQYQSHYLSITLQSFFKPLGVISLFSGVAGLSETFVSNSRAMVSTSFRLFRYWISYFAFAYLGSAIARDNDIKRQICNVTGDPTTLPGNIIQYQFECPTIKRDRAIVSGLWIGGLMMTTLYSLLRARQLEIDAAQFPRRFALLMDTLTGPLTIVCFGDALNFSLKAKLTSSLVASAFSLITLTRLKQYWYSRYVYDFGIKPLRMKIQGALQLALSLTLNIAPIIGWQVAPVATGAMATIAGFILYSLGNAPEGQQLISVEGIFKISKLALFASSSFYLLTRLAQSMGVDPVITSGIHVFDTLAITAAIFTSTMIHVAQRQTERLRERLTVQLNQLDAFTGDDATHPPARIPAETSSIFNDFNQRFQFHRRDFLFSLLGTACTIGLIAINYITPSQTGASYQYKTEGSGFGTGGATSKEDHTPLKLLLIISTATTFIYTASVSLTNYWKRTHPGAGLAVGASRETRSAFCCRRIQGLASSPPQAGLYMTPA